MLILGKKYTKNNPGKIGGVIVLFELFKKELKINNIAFDVIDLNWRNYNNIIFAYFVITVKIITQIPKHKHISFHGTANEFAWLAPVVVFWANFNGKKVSLRKFAGNFIEIFEASHFFKKKLIRYSLSKSNINFFETKYLVNYFNKYNKNTYWFPNVRVKSAATRDISRPFNGKFVFLGHIISEKGIDDILSASKELPKDYSIDLYGPISNSKYNTPFFSKYCKVTYRGVVPPEQILQTLTQYDVLLLPSYWKGEGYPGVIIEALSVGLPVIATNLNGIKEIINDGCGFLILPKSPAELVKAMKSFNKVNYEEYSQNALSRFSEFDSGIVTKRIIDELIHHS